MSCLWAGLFICLNANFLLPLASRMGGRDSGEGPLSIGLYLLIVGLIWYHETTFEFVFRSWLRHGWLLLIFPLLAWASIFWSLDPVLTFKRAFQLTLSTLTMVRICHQMDFKTFLRVLGVTMATMNLLSLGVVVLAPHWGIHTLGNDPTGLWRGLFAHKNNLGSFVGASLLVYGFLWREAPRLWLVQMAIAGVLLVGSHSVSSWAVVGLIGLWNVGRWGLRRGLGAIGKGPALVLALAGLPVLVFRFNAFLEWTGRDWTLTGRTQLWFSALVVGSKRMVLGHGFGAFWTTRNGPVAAIWQGSNWEPGSAHNALLELWLDLGLAGVAIGLVLLGRVLWQCRRNKVGGSTRVFGVTRVLFAYALLAGTTESALFKNSFLWLLLMALSDYLQVLPEPEAAPAAPGAADPGAEPLGLLDHPFQELGTPGRAT